MIKSDLMSCRRQAKTHICHCETDAPTPPSHFSLPHSHSSSHSLIHYTLLSLMGFFFPIKTHTFPNQTPEAFKSRLTPLTHAFLWVHPTLTRSPVSTAGLCTTIISI